METKGPTRQLYYVVNWPYHEHADMSKALHIYWVKAKIDFDLQGDWGKIVTDADPFVIGMTWHVIRALAAHSPYRGLLLTRGHSPQPLTPERIAEIVHLDVTKVCYGMEQLRKKLFWIDVIDVQWDCNDFASVSSRIYRKRYTRKGKRHGSGSRKKPDSIPPKSLNTGQYSTGQYKDPPTPLEKKPERKPKSKPKPVNASELTAAWNEMAKGADLPAIQDFGPKRKAVLGQRSRDNFWVKHWGEAIKAIPDCPFLCGQNERGWKANIEFFLRPTTVAKIIEGHYPGKQRKDKISKCRDCGKSAIGGLSEGRCMECWRKQNTKDFGGEMPKLGDVLSKVL